MNDAQQRWKQEPSKNTRGAELQPELFMTVLHTHVNCSIPTRPHSWTGGNTKQRILSGRLPWAICQQRHASQFVAWRCRASEGPEVENGEVLIGDGVALVCFCLYKQIAAIVSAPDFPGWIAPLSFDLLRFEEFVSFTITVVGTWVAASFMAGNYKISSTADLPTTLAATSLTWLASMPVAAAQLVLLTAAEDQSLVGSEGFGSLLPLAARGPGEPLVTAAGVLGTMLIWRSYYAVYLDFWNFRSSDGSRVDRERDAMHFEQALQAVIALGCVCFLVLKLADFWAMDDALM